MGVILIGMNDLQHLGGHPHPVKVIRGLFAVHILCQHQTDGPVTGFHDLFYGFDLLGSLDYQRYQYSRKGGPHLERYDRQILGKDLGGHHQTGVLFFPVGRIVGFFVFSLLSIFISHMRCAP
jgi:hypothetical protein